KSRGDGGLLGRAGTAFFGCFGRAAPARAFRPSGDPAGGARASRGRASRTLRGGRRVRFQRLHLRAFGPFTNEVLDLSGGAPGGLHVIYGPNEAGKSTSLRAVTGFL